MKQGMFGDFVERNNIMNVFGPLAKTERSEVFFDRSREFTSTQKSIDKTLKSNKRNMSNGEILKNVSKENSLEGLSSVLSKPQIDLQASRFIFFNVENM